MGYKENQSLQTEAEESGLPNDDPPPEYRPSLPPRQSEFLRVQTLPWAQQDPRNASTDSLVPIGSLDGRRTLVLIYIHGFLGDETSFQSFPAHIHNVVTPLVKQTHVVHTKIYPKYRSRKHIVNARDIFSTWIAPHESPTTDFILCGHSMGGLLSAEVALMPRDPSGDKLMHRILGTVNLDVPFLGMHPGVIVSGLGSVFRPAPKSPELNTAAGQVGSATNLTRASSSGLGATESSSTTASLDGMSSMTTVGSQNWSASSQASTVISPGSTFSIPDDPNYNPPYPNDPRVALRKGWEGPLHFIQKHSNELLKASKTYVTSHLEFGGAMADYQGLKRRYQALRALEDVDERQSPNRVRFINYYTASTGRRKPPKLDPASSSLMALDHSQRDQQSDSSRSSAVSFVDADEQRNSGESARGRLHLSGAPASNLDERPPVPMEPSPARSVGSAAIKALTISRPESVEPELLDDLKPVPPQQEEADDLSGLEAVSRDDGLPPLPDQPQEPEPFDPSKYKDKDARKLAEKDYERKKKIYRQAVKDRESALKDRKRLVEKRQKRQQKEQEKAQKEEKKLREKEEKERTRKESDARKGVPNPSSLPETSTAPREVGLAPQGAAEIQTANLDSSSPTAAPEKKQRERRFCILPPRFYHGQIDPTWVRVSMKDVDEVGAHCGIFFTNYPHYEKLVHDVGHQIAEWVAHSEEVRTANID